MTKPQLMFASERSAARLLDMKQGEFSALVQDGHLPRPVDINGIKRWDVEQLRRVLTGEAISEMDDTNW